MGRKPKVRGEVIKLLKELGGEFINQSFIHKVLGVSKARVSEVLQELEDEGLVVRRRLGNQYLVRLTSPSTGHGLRKTIRLGIVWSSEYPFIAPFIRDLELRHGLRVLVRVYESALETLNSLIRGDVELVLAPLVTEIHFYSAFRNLKIIGGGAYDGSAILHNPEAGSEAIASSYLSTMDALRAIALREGDIDAEETLYFRHPKDVVRLAVKGRAKYLVVWHPLLKELVSRGLREVLRPSDLGINYCCTLAASTALPYKLRKVLRREYLNALEEFSRSPSKWFDWYSTIVGIPSDVVRDGWRLYRLNPDIGRDDLMRTLKALSLAIPDPSALSTILDP